MPTPDPSEPRLHTPGDHQVYSLADRMVADVKDQVIEEVRDHLEALQRQRRANGIVDKPRA